MSLSAKITLLTLFAPYFYLFLFFYLLHKIYQLFAATFFGVLGVSLFPAKFVLVGSMALCFIFLLLFKDKI